MIDTLAGLIALTKQTFATLSTQRYEEALSLFRLGVNVHNSKAGVTVTTIAKESNVSTNRLKMCVRLARVLDCDEEKFKEEFSNILYGSFDKVYARCVSRTRRPHTYNNKKIGQLLLDIEQGLEDRDTSAYAEKALLTIKRRINNVLIPDLKIADRDYLKYYGCCSCGSYPPPESGYVLVERDGLTIPLCDECYARDNDIDYKLVATMWNNYAMQLSRVILAGTLNLTENELDDNTYI